MRNTTYRLMALATVVALSVIAASCSHFMKHETSPASDPAAMSSAPAETAAPAADAEKEKEKMDQPSATTPQPQ